MNTVRRHSKGFTLIELMIVVVVIAILASIAFPAYQQYVLQARRADAIAQLLELQSRMERWRVNNASYVGATIALPTSDFYNFTVDNPTATNYTLSATATGAQTRDSACPTLTLNQSGEMGPADGCWKR